MLPRSNGSGRLPASEPPRSSSRRDRFLNAGLLFQSATFFALAGLEGWLLVSGAGGDPLVAVLLAVSAAVGLGLWLMRRRLPRA